MHDCSTHVRIIYTYTCVRVCVCVGIGGQTVGERRFLIRTTVLGKHRSKRNKFLRWGFYRFFFFFVFLQRLLSRSESDSFRWQLLRPTTIPDGRPRINGCVVGNKCDSEKSRKNAKKKKLSENRQNRLCVVDDSKKIIYAIRSLFANFDRSVPVS